MKAKLKRNIEEKFSLEKRNWSEVFFGDTIAIEAACTDYVKETIGEIIENMVDDSELYAALDHKDIDGIIMSTMITGEEVYFSTGFKGMCEDFAWMNDKETTLKRAKYLREMADFLESYEKQPPPIS